MKSAADVNRQVMAMVLAYAGGLAALMVSIAAADSPLAAGIALVWILGVLLYARHTLRCPLCGASVLNAAVGPGLRWLAGPNRRCPRCRASHYEAATARATTPAGGRNRPQRGPRENDK